MPENDDNGQLRRAVVGTDGAGAGSRVSRILIAAVRVVLGMEWEPVLGRAAVITLVSGAAFSTFWSYVGIWAIKALGATPSQLSITFLANAVLSPPAAWIGGYLSDRYGRKPILVCSTGLQSLLILSLWLTGHHVWWGIGLVVAAGVVWAPGRSAINAVVADVIPPERRDQAYAALRTANNLGVVAGPPAAALLLVLGGWAAFLVGIALLGGLTCLLAVRFLPAGRGAKKDEELGLGETLKVVGVDRPFLLLLLATLLGFMVYMSFETVLPVVAVSSFHLAPATWGLLYAVNPVLVLLLQIRLTRWTAAWPPVLTLTVGVLLMGPPFLLLLISSHPAMVTLVVIVFAFGEMLWVPTIQTLISRLAPSHLHGAYMGGYTSSQLLAWMIAPLTGLQLHDILGDRAIWLFFAGLAAVSIAASLVAVRGMSRRAAAAVPAPGDRNSAGAEPAESSRS